MPHFLKPSAFPVSRRATLAGMAGGAMLSALPLKAHALPENASFRHSVASGDPDHESVVIWTRITAEGPQEVRWQVARDLDFTDVLQQGTASTGPERDHTVKLLVAGLEPGATYYYRFILGDAVSPIGRARALPAGSLERLSIALVSCSNYAFGYFNAYDAIARDAEVDFVLHTGDYIYEYGHDGWGDDVAQAIGRRHEPAHEIVSLADYRTRHAQYKTDYGSRAMHAAHTLLACWDDHESANNPWKGGAQNHQPDSEGDWEARRAASIQAYFEWMPVREPEWAGGPASRMQFWRSYSFGDLATLNTLETRHTARAEQIDYLEWSTRLTSPEEVARFKAEVLGEEGRAMLAPELEAELDASWRASIAAGQPWRLIGNPMPIAKTDVPDVVGLGIMPDPFAEDAPFEGEALSAAQALGWKGKWNLPFYPDTWDGYPWAREKLYRLSREAGAGDLIFLTGDSHSFWANQLADDAGRPAGIELGTAGVSSPGDFVASGFGDALSRQLDTVFAQHVPEVVWTDNMHQGYVRLDLTREEGTASFITVDTVLTPQYRAAIGQRFTIRRENGALTFG
ncbi:alkaline phosphatase [Alteraurantiacibacter aquimixticola]|uniref:Alkaline phosphatase n=2 Tax=Alteraurantiacibacter aquimixticola TaxID=2489173 RepID=A0A4T3F077_9SPHN|nr:alkaline phosphatase [Alteraurantiacibacter aquimixticola]